MMCELLDLLNENQGLITLVGLFLVIPFAILHDSINKYLNRKKDKEELERLLLRELWMNINLVAQIEESYKTNLTDVNLHVPHYPPRTETLNNLIKLNLIDSLEKSNKDCILEIYSQLENLKREYYLWREKVLSPILIENKEIYTILSSTMISYIDPAMRNMLDLWIGIVSRKGSTSSIPQIQKLNDLILREIRSGKWIATSYRASRLINNKPIKMRDFDVIMCWENDMKGIKTQKEIIEIRDLILLHESWR